jgi:HSP20 family protein
MRWEPFKDLLSLQDRMNQLFEESLARGTVKQPDERPGHWSPAVDILETESEIILMAEVPGLDLDDIELQIRDNVLTFRGERTIENAVKKEHYFRIERAYGNFSRSFTLPSTIDQERVEARLKDGILDVRMPKRTQGGSGRSITVEVK